MTLMRVWQDFLDLQEGVFGKSAVDHWLRSLHIAKFDAGNLFLEAHSPFQIAWVEEHLKPLLKEGIMGPSGRKIKIHLHLAGSLDPAEKIEPIDNGSLPQIKESKNPLSGSMLLPHALFDLFVTSRSNFFTREVLQKQSHAYNPIFISGPTGSGKTHLLMSLAHHLRDKGLKTLYVKLETFTEHVVWGIKQGTMRDFRSFYRHVDVLIVDDVHLLSSKVSTQEEFFHTFNTLHGEEKRIILASALAPSQLHDIEPRLISRFEWGLTLPLMPIDHPEELKELLDKRLRFHSLSLEPKLYQYLLEKGSSPLKLSQGIEYLLISLSGSDQKIVQLDRVYHDLERIYSHKTGPTIDSILSAVSHLFGLKASDLTGKSQSRQFALARKISMYLLRKELKLPYMQIGRALSRDHSTVMSSIKQVSDGLENNDQEISYYLSGLKSKIAGE